MDQAEARGSRRLDSKAAAALYSVAVNLVLIGAKLAVGLLTGSVAILADAAHSFLDLSASIFAYLGIRTAAKPADEDHAWGHAKAENISSLIQMFLLGATCIALADESVHVDGALTLARAHEVGHAVAERIRRELPVVSDAVVHVEPVDDVAHG